MLSDRIITSTVPPEAAGMRLDLWLCSRFTYRSRNSWQNVIKASQIRINGYIARSSRILNSGDIVSYTPGDEIKEPQTDNTYSVVFEDDFLLLVNKSGDLPCHPAGIYYKNTLWYLLSEKYGQVHIINRLDRETSGLVLAAKDAETASTLSKIFEDKHSGLVKKYLALVHGVFPDGEIDASGFLLNDAESPVRKKRKFVSGLNSGEEGESCRTLFRKRFARGDFSLLEVLPVTGRLHQIRATALALGYPLVGDKLYGLDDGFFIRFIEDALSESDRENLILNRQALHAYSLSFVHPRTKMPLCFEISEPDEFSALYQRV